MLKFKTFLLEKQMVKFNKLSIRDLKKDENRVLNFLKKIREGKPFETMDTSPARSAQVTIHKSEYDAVQLFMQAQGGKFPADRSSMYVKTSKGKLLIPGHFKKTGDFGGRGQGSGTAAETLAMNYFNEELNKILGREALPEIKLKINGRIVRCAAMVKTEGKYKGREPKSDMTIVDADGKPVAYISHKAGNSAKSYQQYGGVSDSALPRKYHNNKNVKAFMQDVDRLRSGGLVSGDSFYRDLNDKEFIGMMMYGPKFGGRPDISNVDEFHLGNMNLKGSKAGPYVITSNHKGENGDIPKGSFKAVLFIRYQGNRGDARAAGEVIKNARVGVFPLAKISGNTKKI